MSLDQNTEQPSGFQLKMYRQVIADHAEANEHNAYCCGIVESYQEILKRSGETPKPTKSEPKRRYSDPRPATIPQINYVKGLIANKEISTTEMEEWAKQLRKGLTFGQAAWIIDNLKERPVADPGRIRMATDAMKGYIQNLLDTREWTSQVDLGSLTFAEAKKLIDDLKASPRKTTEIQEGASREGVYFYKGRYVKVQRAIHGSGRLYTKVFNPRTEEWGREGLLLSRLEPQHKLTAEKAAQFGALYGRCVSCDKTLTKESAIARGYGDDCGRKNGWPL